VVYCELWEAIFTCPKGKIAERIEPQEIEPPTRKDWKTTIMAPQFLVRSQGLNHQLKLNTVVYDGVEIVRLKEGLIPVFEFADEVELQLVVRRKKHATTSTAASTASNNLITTSTAVNDIGSNQLKNAPKREVRVISSLL
jgi:hypothetical protein